MEGGSQPDGSFDEQPIDAFDRHEVLHSSLIVAELFENWIEQHRFTQSRPELRIAAERLVEQLNDFYQAVGRQALT